MEKLTESFFRSNILGENAIYRNKFKEHFKDEIDQFCKEAFIAYGAYKTITVSNEARRAIISGFIHNAMQNIISAFDIFISGYIVAPGNLMRQHYESVSWAILCSTGQLSYYDKIKEIFDASKENSTKNYKKLSDAIEFSKGVKLVEDNLPKFFGINENSWKQLIKARKSYNNFSHCTLVSMSTNAVINDEGGVILGAYFDIGKIKHYKNEIKTMVNTVIFLPNIIQGINQQIKKENL